MTFGTLPPPCSLWKEFPDTIIRKMTGHRSEELERYKHLDMTFANQSVERSEVGSQADSYKFSYTPENSNARRKATGANTTFY
jgi:hypothetical protein